MEPSAEIPRDDPASLDTPKFTYKGEEVTLPGQGEREYRIGSPHQDYEDYKSIAEANHQHDVSVAAQTSDSLGDAVETVARANQSGTDYTAYDELFHEKYGHTPYTDPAYSESQDISPAPIDSANDKSTLDGNNSVSTDDSQSSVIFNHSTSFKDSQDRNISLKRWGDQNLIQLRAYDTDLGDVPENPNIGTAGMANLQVETTTDGSTQVRLQDIVIPPDYRNSGIAGNMLDQTVEIAKAKGAGEIYGVIENEEALAYWKHMEEKGNGWKIDPDRGAYGYVRYEVGSKGVAKK